MENINSTSRNFSLDLLRILAVLSVLGVHQFWPFIEFINENLNKFNLVPVTYIINSYFWSGLSGVCIFFFVSGWAITVASLKESPKSFAVRRFFRIYPLYISLTILEITLTRISSSENTNISELVKNCTLNILMVGDFLNVNPNISGVAWTLRIELYFYILVWFSLLFEKRNKNIPLIRLLILVTTMVIMAAFNFPQNPTMGNQYYVGIFFPFLVLGACCAFFQKKLISTKLCVLISIVALTQHVVLSLNLKPDFFSEGSYLLATFVTIILSFSIKPKNTHRKRVFKFANYTYGFYLLHTFFLSFLILQIKKNILPVNMFVDFLVSIAATLVTIFIASKVYVYFEKPMQDFSRFVK
jgi:peptidoglycan/LPS O-acetylase OafA/YrhL